MMKKALGKGLSALIPDTYIRDNARAAAAAFTGQPVTASSMNTPVVRPAAEGGLPQGLQLLEIARIRPNPEQPRQTFSEESIEELAQSIKEKGVLQPILVRP